jgi:hypothetical protein
VDAHDRLTLPATTPTLDHAEWGKDPDLELGFDPVLDQIQYLAENGLTSLMVLHDFLSKRLMPLQDRPRPAWMYTGGNDIMRLDRGPGSSLDEGLLVAYLKALILDQFSTELVAPPAAYEPICMNQAVRMTLLAVMSMLDDVDIAMVQRGDQSHGMVIPGTDVSGGLGGAIGGHGGVVVGGRAGVQAVGGPTGNRGSGAAGSSGPAPAPSNGKEK